MVTQSMPLRQRRQHVKVCYQTSIRPRSSTPMPPNTRYAENQEPYCAKPSKLNASQYFVNEKEELESRPGLFVVEFSHDQM